MDIGLRDIVLPESQRRTLEELTEDLDLRSGDARAKQSAFWTMLVLSGIIATAGIISDSTATVIGAMIIAPLSTPIMAIALGIVRRERIRAGRFVVIGAVVVVLLGALGAFIVPGGVDLHTNSQITGRTSPTVIDLVAAIATGFAGAVGLSRRDVAAVLPGVAIAISLVPPLAVVGVCLGEGAVLMALGALLLFVSNLVSMVIAGTVLFAALGYASEAEREAHLVGAERKSFLTLGIVLALVLVPLAANTALVVALHSLSTRIQTVAETWLAGSPQAEVTDVEYTASAFRVDVRTPPGQLPPTSSSCARWRGRCPTGCASSSTRRTGRRSTRAPRAQAEQSAAAVSRTAWPSRGPRSTTRCPLGTWAQARPRKVQTQTLLPSGSARIVNDGASESSTTAPPAATAAAIRASATSGATQTSGCQR